VSAVGIVAISLGVFFVCSRGALLLAPGATLDWFKGTIATNGRTRLLGGFLLILGAAMAWAGASEESALATILTIFGWVIVGLCLLGLVLFPGVYRAISNAMLPSDSSGRLLAWRFRGLTGVLAGVLFIYFGALAL